MGRTYVNATIVGQNTSKEYSFLVDTGSTFMGLPEEEIEELGLTLIPDGRRNVLTSSGIDESETYLALGRLDDRGFAATVLPRPIPLIGYETLENMRFKVNPVSGVLEEVPLDEPHPPYQL